MPVESVSSPIPSARTASGVPVDRTRPSGAPVLRSVVVVPDAVVEPALRSGRGELAALALRLRGALREAGQAEAEAMTVADDPAQAAAVEARRSALAAQVAHHRRELDRKVAQAREDAVRRVEEAGRRGAGMIRDELLLLARQDQPAAGRDEATVTVTLSPPSVPQRPALTLIDLSDRDPAPEPMAVPAEDAAFVADVDGLVEAVGPVVPTAAAATAWSPLPDAHRPDRVIDPSPTAPVPPPPAAAPPQTDVPGPAQAAPVTGPTTAAPPVPSLAVLIPDGQGGTTTAYLPMSSLFAGPFAGYGMMPGAVAPPPVGLVPGPVAHPYAPGWVPAQQHYAPVPYGVPVQPYGAPAPAPVAAPEARDATPPEPLLRRLLHIDVVLPVLAGLIVLIVLFAWVG
jgi:hypothetical protein